MRFKPCDFDVCLSRLRTRSLKRTHETDWNFRTVELPTNEEYLSDVLPPVGCASCYSLRRSNAMSGLYICRTCSVLFKNVATNLWVLVLCVRFTCVYSRLLVCPRAWKWVGRKNERVDALVSWFTGREEARERRFFELLFVGVWKTLSYCKCALWQQRIFLQGVPFWDKSVTRCVLVSRAPCASIKVHAIFNMFSPLLEWTVSDRIVKKMTTAHSIKLYFPDLREPHNRLGGGGGGEAMSRKAVTSLFSGTSLVSGTVRHYACSHSIPKRRISDLSESQLLSDTRPLF